MKFTIGTITDYQGYENDVNLIKSSILYADEIELIGMTEYAVFRYIPSIIDSKQSLEELISSLITFLKSSNIPNVESTIMQLESLQSLLEVYAPLLKKKKRRSREELLAQLNAERSRKEIIGILTTMQQDLIDQPCSQELNDLVQKGVISVFDYQFSGINTYELAGGYMGNLLHTIFSQNTFPLFDDASMQFIGSISKANIIDISKLDAEVLRHAGVATSILMTLPTLREATFDELLDLKRQNNDPLIRFRSAIYEYSEEISSLPWDKDFRYECIKLYDTKVAPQVAEINEIFTQTSTLKNLGRQVLADEELRKKAGFAIGGLATAITSSNQLSHIIPQMLFAMLLAAFSKEAASGLLKAIHLSIQSYDETKSQKEKAKSNVMYYYYLASKLNT